MVMKRPAGILIRSIPVLVAAVYTAFFNTKQVFAALTLGLMSFCVFVPSAVVRMPLAVLLTTAGEMTHPYP